MRVMQRCNKVAYSLNNERPMYTIHVGLGDCTKLIRTTELHYCMVICEGTEKLQGYLL